MKKIFFLTVFLCLSSFGFAEVDFGKALKLAEQGNADIQVYVAAMYEEGKGVTQDYKEAMKWYLKAAEQGHAVAQFIVGAIYNKGQSVPQDYKESAKWYLKAAEQGEAQAQFNIGVMYNRGQGVPQNDNEAVKWYLKAAEQGVAKAQFNIGIMYSEGRGVIQDYKETMKWFIKAAEQGDAKAQFFVAVMYELGRGVTQDDIQAHAWYNLAGANGSVDAVSARESIEAKMTPVQIEKAQELAKKLFRKDVNKETSIKESELSPKEIFEMVLSILKKNNMSYNDLEQYLTPSFFASIKEDEIAGELEADPILQVQDDGFSSYNLSEPSVSDNMASIKASFSYDGSSKPHVILVVFLKIDGKWRIKETHCVD